MVLQNHMERTVPNWTTTSIEDFQQEQQNCLENVTQRKNIDLIKMFKFHAISKKSLGRKPLSTLKEEINVSGENRFPEK